MVKSGTLIICSILMVVLPTSCFKSHKYKFTSKVCERRLFVEVFEANSLGLDADYLTDSLNFRKYIGDWDEEHERYSYTCKGDSIYVLKMVSGNRWTKWDTTADGKRTVVSNSDTTETLNFSLQQLRSEKNFK
jgi:hypothetical protein